MMRSRHAWCFKAEDYVGRISKLAHSASVGARATLLSVKILKKYRLMMDVRLWKGLL